MSSDSASQSLPLRLEHLTKLLYSIEDKVVLFFLIFSKLYFFFIDLSNFNLFLYYDDVDIL